jgi:hypothetical protein
VAEVGHETVLIHDAGDGKQSKAQGLPDDAMAPLTHHTGGPLVVLAVLGLPAMPESTNSTACAHRGLLLVLH